MEVSARYTNLEFKSKVWAGENWKRRLTKTTETLTVISEKNQESLVLGKPSEENVSMGRELPIVLNARQCQIRSELRLTTGFIMWKLSVTMTRTVSLGFQEKKS